MRELVWLDRAVNDIVRLRQFIEPHNPNAAEKAAKTIKNAAKRLRAHPNIGKPIEDLPDYRDLGIRFGASGYIMRYRVFEKVIYVVHIRHYRESGFKTPSAEDPPFLQGKD